MWGRDCDLLRVLYLSGGEGIKNKGNHIHRYFRTILGDIKNYIHINNTAQNNDTAQNNEEFVVSSGI